MRLVLVGSSLRAGGTERVLALLANYWATGGHQVTLVTLDTDELDAYQLAPGIARKALGLLRQSRGTFGALLDNLRRLRALRRVMATSAPEVVICLGDRMNVLTLLAAAGTRVPVVVSERTDPKRHEIGPAWDWLRARLYRHAAAVVVQTEEAKQWVLGMGTRPGAAYVIPNPAREPPAGALPECLSGRLSGRSLVVAMGRLVPAKGYDLLLRAYSLYQRDHPNWTLVIVGEGSERQVLTDLALTLGIQSGVVFTGFLANPAAVLLRAELFVMSSRYEGFPNALLEAMACGLPVISFDCSSGPREIVRNGVDGLLVPCGDVHLLGDALDRLMSDSAERKRLASRARDVLARFGTDTVMAKWQLVLESVVMRCP